MSHTPHELHAEFPEHEARIHELKESDAHFAKLELRPFNLQCIRQP